MWLWQQNKAKTLLMVRIASITFVLHGCVMGLLFFIQGHSSLSFTVSTRKLLEGQRIVVVPFYKKGSVRSGNTAKQVPQLTQGKNKLKKMGIKQPEKTVMKKQVIPKKNKSLNSLKKKLPKNKPVSMKKTPPAADLKKVALPEVEHKTAPLVDKVVTPESVASHEPLVQPLQDDTVYMQHHEYDALVIQEQIQREIIRCWSPPPGIAAGTQCVVTLYVTWQGSLDRYTVQQSSGVLMFDMSVRASLKDIIFPRATYGKELTITFMQETERCR